MKSRREAVEVLAAAVVLALRANVKAKFLVHKIRLWFSNVFDPRNSLPLYYSRLVNYLAYSFVNNFFEEKKKIWARRRILFAFYLRNADSWHIRICVYRSLSITQLY